MESDSMRTQLSTLATQLQKAVNLVKPVEKTSEQQRAAFFGHVVSDGMASRRPCRMALLCLLSTDWP